MTVSRTIAQYMRQLRIVHAAITFMCLGAALLSYTMPIDNGYADHNEQFVYVGAGIGIFIGIFSLFIWKNRITQAAGQATLTHKLLAYQSGSIIFFAMLEGAALLNFTLYYIDAQMANFYIGVAFLLVLVGRFPNKNTIGNLLSLSNQELIYLHKDDHILD